MHVGSYSGGLIFGGGAYTWNEVSVSTSGGLTHGGGLIFGGGGLCSEVYGTLHSKFRSVQRKPNKCKFTQFRCKSEKYTTEV
jgi:hypothetical protein